MSAGRVSDRDAVLSIVFSCRVKTHCTEFRSTSCLPCLDGTYLDKPNGLEACISCTTCDAVSGVTIKRPCTSTSDTVCEPLNGFYCIDSQDSKDGCRAAEKHRRCTKGEFISTSGTPWSDTKCTRCDDGKFSDGTFTSCKPHTECGQNLSLIRPGTNSTDAECGEQSISTRATVGIDHNSRSGADQRSWKWFEQMDAIYGHRHASIGRAMARDTATTSEPFKGKRRKRNTLSDIASIMEESHEHDRRLMERMDQTLERYTDRQEIMQQKRLDQLERHHQQFSEQMREAHREELTETQIFNRTFLTHFGNLVKAMSDRRE
ncbi:uncharacterized protein KZ484_015119 [Pholidichthys leucotaenia]